MRKLLLPIIIVFVLSLCSCKTGSQVKPTVKQISFTAEAVWDKTEYQVSAVTDGDLETEFTVISPEKIGNLKLTFSGDTVKLYFLELEHETQITCLPEGSPVRVIYEALKSADSENLKVYSENNKYFIRYNIGDTDYRLVLAETGLPLEITDKNGENRILFKDVTILN